MVQAVPKVTTESPNVSAAHLGAFADLNKYKFSHPGLPFEIEGKVFLNSLLNLTSSEVSLNKMPAKGAMPFYHHHQNNEEIYIFIKGKGEFQVDGKSFSVSEGSVVRVAPQGIRCWRNLSDEPLYYIVIQAPTEGYTGNNTIDDGVAVNDPVKWAS